MSGFITLVAVVYGALVGALYLFQRNLLYYPAGSMPPPAESGLPEMSVVTLSTADGLTLKSWYAAAGEGKPTLVYFTGNAGHIGYRAFKARRFLDAGLGMLLVSYRGFGGNPGKPTERGLYADGRAALDFLAARGVGAGRVVLYGESLGTGVAVHLASERAAETPVAALVLEAPFTSIVDVAAHHYPFVPARWLVKDRFDSAAKIAGVRAPVLVLHAEDDQIIPIRFGRRLFEAASQPKESRWFAFGGHEGLYDFGADETVLGFLARRLDPSDGRQGIERRNTPG